MNDEEGIDFQKLEKELASAVEADAKYQRENDAKFRAVEQRVASYEEFRDIVNASHLKPLERKDLMGEKTISPPWNPHAHKRSQNASVHSATIWSPSSQTPQSANEFTKVWRHQYKTKLEKYQLLLKMGGQELQRIFKTEISMGLLGEFLVTLQNCFEDKDAYKISHILMDLSKTNRFDLSLKFLNEKERNSVTDLVKKLGVSEPENKLSSEVNEEGRSSSRKNCYELARIYGVTM